MGEWSDVLFSEELYNAEQYGYTFKIKSGYLFERGKVFDGYIKEIYSIKENTPDSDPMYFISKLLLNSLYGKFAMALEFDEHKIIKSTALNSYINNPQIEVSNTVDVFKQIMLLNSILFVNLFWYNVIILFLLFMFVLKSFILEPPMFMSSLIYIV